MNARFINNKLALHLAANYGSPLYVYSETELRENAANMLSIEAPFGRTIRFAMKANPNRHILQLFNGMGIQIDASSGFEAQRALLAGIPGEHILITAQELPQNLSDLVKAGVQFNACSLNQLHRYGELFPGTNITVRINPGQGDGFHSYTNVGGPDASFGIWHEDIEQVHAICETFNLTVTRLHTHIGSGTDPEVWKRVTQTSVDLLNHFPAATTLNLGGGFKVARMPYEKSTDPQEVGTRIQEVMTRFHEETGREIHIELEPGTYLTANAGSILSRIQDISSSGNSGRKFYKLDCGMSEILRPSYYGAQHPITVYPEENRETQEVVVVGHSCESADLLTTKKGNGEEIEARQLPVAVIGDLIVIDGAGAYCSSMNAKNYNSFPEIAEVLVNIDGSTRLIRRRQNLEQMINNEMAAEKDTPIPQVESKPLPRQS
jgi:diaminopimelate decarboxylase